jgi:hypothetical protein
MCTYTCVHTYTCRHTIQSIFVEVFAFKRPTFTYVNRYLKKPIGVNFVY